MPAFRLALKKWVVYSIVGVSLVSQRYSSHRRGEYQVKWLFSWSIHSGFLRRTATLALNVQFRQSMLGTANRGRLKLDSNDLTQPRRPFLSG
ncbi:hypothetical protein GALMADRAFT_230898 [Galerina marginata CBS 339.88]|uniref:Uncharacterized protein n=1 Tax=Galerina marginata (strain CBS 339.88) TaxID=685588 RepID=A0A067SN36_GALM3|nr:hypothetical protein GALMADRAFT_230898 [Galerina marginata CBS 339.88]